MLENSIKTCFGEFKKDGALFVGNIEFNNQTIELAVDRFSFKQDDIIKLENMIKQAEEKYSDSLKKAACECLEEINNEWAPNLHFFQLESHEKYTEEKVINLLQLKALTVVSEGMSLGFSFSNFITISVDLDCEGNYNYSTIHGG